MAESVPTNSQLEYALQAIICWPRGHPYPSVLGSGNKTVSLI